MRNFLLLAILVGLTLTAAGCNTVNGLGEDVSAVGGWFTRGSDNVQDSM